MPPSNVNSDRDPPPPHPEQAPQVLMVFVTVPNVHVGAHIARTLVQERLAACVNLVPNIRSIYVWEGQLHEEDEGMCLIKTQVDLFDRLKTRLLELHPYQVPEILGVEAARGHEPYLRWLTEATTTPTP